MAALKRLGVRAVVGFSAVGSLREEVRPRDFLVAGGVVDWTKGVSFVWVELICCVLSCLYVRARGDGVMRKARRGVSGKLGADWVVSSGTTVDIL